MLDGRSGSVWIDTPRCGNRSDKRFACAAEFRDYIFHGGGLVALDLPSSPSMPLGTYRGHHTSWSLVPPCCKSFDLNGLSGWLSKASARLTIDLANSLAGQAEFFADLSAASVFEVNLKEHMPRPSIEHTPGQIAQFESALEFRVLIFRVTPFACEYVEWDNLGLSVLVSNGSIAGHQA